MDHNPSVQYSEVSALQTNKVLRNTYMLLSMTLLFSAFTAWLATAMNMPIMSPWIFLIGYFALLFGTHAARNSAFGIVLVFALTGFIGMFLGPIVNMVSTQMSNGTELVMLALGGTGVIFLTMSGIALTTKKDLSGTIKFLGIGILVAFIAAIANMFFQIPALGLAISSAFMILASGVIMWQTQQIVRGGETNYITATVTLYVMMYNIFMSLLHLLMAFMGED